MAENNKQIARELLTSGYAKNFEKHQKSEKDRQVFEVELTEQEKQHGSAHYKMAKWYEQKAKKEQSGK